MDEARSETVVPAAPDEAWEAITDPERLEQWLADEVELELEPGGDLTIRTGEEERTGFVEEVDAPRRLVFWWAADEAESTRVEIELEPDADGTRVLVVETRPLAALGTVAEPLALAAA